MATYWPLSIPEHGVGLNLTVMSYAGAMGFGFTTARSAVPDARELTAALLAALDELVGRTPAPTPRKPAPPPKVDSVKKAVKASKRPKAGTAAERAASSRTRRVGAQKP
jgi:hypothetical protein